MFLTCHRHSPPKNHNYQQEKPQLSTICSNVSPPINDGSIPLKEPIISIPAPWVRAPLLQRLKNTPSRTRGPTMNRGILYDLPSGKHPKKI